MIDYYVSQLKTLEKMKLTSSTSIEKNIKITFFFGLSFSFSIRIETVELCHISSFKMRVIYFCEVDQETNNQKEKVK